jgi:hypothetical protein
LVTVPVQELGPRYPGVELSVGALDVELGLSPSFTGGRLLNPPSEAPPGLLRWVVTDGFGRETGSGCERVGVGAGVGAGVDDGCVVVGTVGVGCEVVGTVGVGCVVVPVPPGVVNVPPGVVTVPPAATPPAPPVELLVPEGVGAGWRVCPAGALWAGWEAGAV